MKATGRARALRAVPPRALAWRGASLGTLPMAEPGAADRGD